MESRFALIDYMQNSTRVVELEKFVTRLTQICAKNKPWLFVSLGSGLLCFNLDLYNLYNLG
jgi:hypothetical protein